MPTITTHFKIHIHKTDTYLKVTYRGKSFSMLERLKGSINDKTLKEIGRIIPPKVDNVDTWQAHFKDSLTITPIDKKKTPFSKFNDAWFAFYEARTNVPPKFNGADANHLKQIIAYLKKITGTETEALELWEGILHNWKHLDEFHQKNTDLKYINSSLNKIITNVKQISKTGSKGVNDDYLRNIVNDLRS